MKEVKMENNREVFFTSDHHFGHKNVIKYTNRPFADVEEMDAEMIKRYNSVVTKKDIVYFIGDFSFYSDAEKVIDILMSLNGEKHFVSGNHDKGMHYNEKIVKCFQTYSRVPYKEIYVPDASVRNGKQAITLCHYAMRVWNKSHHGAFHLYGHSHGSLPDDPNSLSFDVGVDAWDFYPVSYTQVKETMAKKTWKAIDHHGRD